MERMVWMYVYIVAKTKTIYSTLARKSPCKSKSRVRMLIGVTLNAVFVNFKKDTKETSVFASFLRRRLKRKEDIFFKKNSKVERF